jgi:hypothetical protein
MKKILFAAFVFVLSLFLHTPFALAYSCSPSVTSLYNNSLTSQSTITDNNGDCTFTGHFSNGIVGVTNTGGVGYALDGTYTGVTLQNGVGPIVMGTYPAFSQNDTLDSSPVTLWDTDVALGFSSTVTSGSVVFNVSADSAGPFKFSVYGPDGIFITNNLDNSYNGSTWDDVFGNGGLTPFPGVDPGLGSASSGGYGDWHFLLTDSTGSACSEYSALADCLASSDYVGEDIVVHVVAPAAPPAPVAYKPFLGVASSTNIVGNTVRAVGQNFTPVGALVALPVALPLLFFVGRSIMFLFL